MAERSSGAPVTAVSPMREAVQIPNSATMMAAVRLGDVDLMLVDLLDDAERQLAEQLRPDKRHRFLAGRIALRVFLGERAGVDPGALRASYRCPGCSGTLDRVHGMPDYVLPGRRGGTSVSLSRSGAWCLMACTLDPGVLGLGVDLQDAADTDFAGFETVALAPAELQLLPPGGACDAYLTRARLWARKEAVLKALGVGVMVPPRSVDVTGRIPVMNSGPSRVHGLTVRDVDPVPLGIPHGFAAALAIHRIT